MSSIFQKYIMAITGLIMVGFVGVHMLGNLQVFMEPKHINAYAYFLHYTLPWEFLYLFRAVLIVAVVAHVVVAINLTRQNRKARPQGYQKGHNNQASCSSRTMRLTGSIVLLFIIFHILHFTVRSVHPEYDYLRFMLNGKETTDVYAMLVYGFSGEFWYVSIFYIVAMLMIAKHLAHGVSSMFQTLGLRNARWKGRLDALALVYGWGIFLGMASIPASVLISQYTPVQILPTHAILHEIEDWDKQSDIFVDYKAVEKAQAAACPYMQAKQAKLTNPYSATTDACACTPCTCVTCACT